MDEDRDPFLEDEGSKGVDTQDVHFVDAENKFRKNSTSPILNCTGSGTSSSHAGRRKGRIRMYVLICLCVFVQLCFEGNIHI